MKKSKLKLTRQTIRQLSAEPLGTVRGGIVVIPWTRVSCALTNCCPSLVDSCYNTQCCLEKP